MKDDKGHGSDSRGGGDLSQRLQGFQRGVMNDQARQRGGSAMDRAVAAIKQEFGGQRHPAQVAADHGIRVSHLSPSTGDMHKDIANAVAKGMSRWGK